jgi:hypothetical protein
MAARIREGVQLSFGGVLHPRRWPPTRLSRCSAVQPLATWAALSERYTLEPLCELAGEKDAGFRLPGSR